MDFRPIHQSKRRFASLYLLLLIDTCSFPTRFDRYLKRDGYDVRPHTNGAAA